MRMIQPEPAAASADANGKAAPRKSKRVPATDAEKQNCARIEAVGSLNDRDSLYTRLFARDQRAQNAAVLQQQLALQRKMAEIRKRRAIAARARLAVRARTGTASFRTRCFALMKANPQYTQLAFAALPDEIQKQCASARAFSRTKEVLNQARNDSSILAIQNQTPALQARASLGFDALGSLGIGSALPNWLDATKPSLRPKDLTVTYDDGSSKRINQKQFGNRIYAHNTLFYDAELKKSKALLDQSLASLTQTLASAKKMQAELARVQRNHVDLLSSTPKELDRLISSVTREQTQLYQAATVEKKDGVSTEKRQWAAITLLTSRPLDVQEARRQVYNESVGKAHAIPPEKWGIDRSLAREIDADRVAALKKELDFAPGLDLERTVFNRDRDQAQLDRDQFRKKHFGADDGKGLNILTLARYGFADGRLGVTSCPKAETDCETWSWLNHKRIAREIEKDVDVLTDERNFDQEKRAQVFKNIVARGNVIEFPGEAEKTKFADAQDSQCRTKFATNADLYRTCVDTAPAVFSARVREVAGTNFLPNHLWNNAALGNRLARGYGGPLHRGYARHANGADHRTAKSDEGLPERQARRRRSLG